MKRARLEEFRQAAYKYLGRAKDATFELTDAILLTRNVYCLAELSLSPVFRRKWPSIYEALQDSRPQRQKLMQLYIKQIPAEGRPLLAGDHTNWSRPDAVRLQERTYEHSGTSIAGNKPITIGQGYSTIAWIPENEGSWALPLRHERITSAESPIGMLIIRVERLDAQGNMRTSKPLWLAWVGEEMPPLESVWSLYLRRFTIDHWYRFLKQRLHWTVPNLSTPKQCDRWSDLMPLMTWELWLARDIVTDNPLPWQKSQGNLTPGRVAQAMGGVFAAIGTPTSAPKPRGKSPGWQPGKKRHRKNRCPIVKKTVARPPKEPSAAV